MLATSETLTAEDKKAQQTYDRFYAFMNDCQLILGPITMLLGDNGSQAPEDQFRHYHLCRDTAYTNGGHYTTLFSQPILEGEATLREIRQTTLDILFTHCYPRNLPYLNFIEAGVTPAKALQQADITDKLVETMETAAAVLKTMVQSLLETNYIKAVEAAAKSIASIDALADYQSHNEAYKEKRVTEIMSSFIEPMTALCQCSLVDIKHPILNPEPSQALALTGPVLPIETQLVELLQEAFPEMKQRLITASSSGRRNAPHTTVMTAEQFNLNKATLIALFEISVSTTRRQGMQLFSSAQQSVITPYDYLKDVKGKLGGETKYNKAIQAIRAILESRDATSLNRAVLKFRECKKEGYFVKGSTFGASYFMATAEIQNGLTPTESTQHRLEM